MRIVVGIVVVIVDGHSDCSCFRRWRPWENSFAELVMIVVKVWWWWWWWWCLHISKNETNLVYRVSSGHRGCYRIPCGFASVKHRDLRWIKYVIRKTSIHVLCFRQMRWLSLLTHYWCLYVLGFFTSKVCLKKHVFMFFHDICDVL